MRVFKVQKVQNVSSECVVCGTRNPFSLGAKFFELEDDFLVGVLSPKDHHQSYPQRMHGGMISAVIDETIGRAVQIGAPDVWGVTGELKIRYIKPTPLNTELRCFAKLVQNSAKLFKGVAILETDQGELVASGEATYMKLDIDKISEGFSDDDWFYEEGKIPDTITLFNDNALEKLCNK